MTFQILLVDNEPDDIKLIENQLSKIKMDLNFDSVGSREAFQEYLIHKPLPDLVICDYQLPEYNGEKALEFIQNLNDYVPVILITENLDEENVFELLKKGASDIITKQNFDHLGIAVQRELINFSERKKTQLELEINEARYRALVENGSDVLFILSPEGQTKYISPSIKNVLGYTAEEAMQLNMMEKAHPDDTEMIIKEIQKCLDQPGVPIKVPPARLKNKDGKYHWFEGTITNMLHDPAIEGIVDNFYDITDRVEAEQKTAQAKNQYQSLVQSVDGIVWEADAETLIFTYVSPQVQKILGYSPEEWIGKKDFWQNRIHPEDRERAISFCSQQTEKGVNHTFEYRMRKADGDYIWLRDVVTVVKEMGKPITLRGLMMDIDQEKLLELKLEMAYQLAKIGSWELSLVNEKLHWSTYIKELHEVDDDYQPNLESAINFYTEGWSRDTISKVVEHSISEGEPFDVELQIETAKGNKRWIRAVGQPEFIDDTCVRIYGSTQNITDRIEHEKSLKILNRELVESNAELEQFAFVVSHDLQEPLRMITGFLSQLDRKYDHLLDETGKKYIHFATDGAKRMRQIILDLLEFSRVGRIDSEREQVDMNDQVQEALALNKKMITEQKAEIKVGKLPVIQAAKVPMRQLFQNLINNAVKYHKKGRKPIVTINADEDDHFWHFEIEDNGIGIDQENSVKIFNIFHRLHVREEYSGSGIGLAICKKIVENHGGTISVASEPNKGSTFYFSIAK